MGFASNFEQQYLVSRLPSYSLLNEHVTNTMEYFSKEAKLYVRKTINKKK